MEDSAPARNSLSIPLAIVIAGALVAVAVYVSRGGAPATDTAAQQQNTTPPVAQPTQVESAITVRAIGEADHSLGNPASPLAVIVYTDLECPFCKSFHNTMRQVADTYGKNGSVLWVYRHFPLTELHSKAAKESEAAECAAELGGKEAFWDYVDELFKITPSNNGLDPSELPKIAARIGLDTQVEAFDACLSSNKYAQKVSNDRNEAGTAGGTGTPFSVFVGKKSISEKTLASIQKLNEETVSPYSPNGLLTVSTDKRRVSMSGALQFIFVQRLIDTLLNN